jgi:hypothetical protein
LRNGDDVDVGIEIGGVGVRGITFEDLEGLFGVNIIIIVVIVVVYGKCVFGFV